MIGWFEEDGKSRRSGWVAVETAVVVAVAGASLCGLCLWSGDARRGERVGPGVGVGEVSQRRVRE